MATKQEKKSAPVVNEKQETAMTAPSNESTAMTEYEDYGDDAGRGFENQDATDRKIPMIVILQSNTKLVKENPRVLFGGLLYNTVTKQAYKSIEFVPCVTDKVHIEWVSRDNGGGFKGRHPSNSEIVLEAIKRNGGKAFGKLAVPAPIDPVTKQVQKSADGKKDLPPTELVETREIAGIMYQAYDADGNKMFDDDFAMPIVIPFKSIGINVYKAFSSDVGMFMTNVKQPDGTTKKKPAPMFAHRFRLTTKEDNRASGDSYQPVLEPAEGTIPKSLMKKTDYRFQLASDLNQQFLKGVARADYDSAQNAEASDGTASSATAKAEDAPF